MLNKFSFNFLRVGISETICTHKNKIKNKFTLNPRTLILCCALCIAAATGARELPFTQLCVGSAIAARILNKNIASFYSSLIREHSTKLTIVIEGSGFIPCYKEGITTFHLWDTTASEGCKVRYTSGISGYSSTPGFLSQEVSKAIRVKFLSTNAMHYFNLKSLADNLIENIKVKDNHNNEISLKFRQWFAGISDGDGYIYVNKSGNVGYELTLPSSDERVLRIIQNKFGGNIHARAGIRAVRYRTQKRETITKIIHCLNGLVINNIRLAQLHKACLALNIPIKFPIFPTIESAYLSGLLDSDGTINFYKHNYNDTFRYQLTVSITNKSKCNIDFLLNIIGGQIYFDKTKNGCYK